MKETGQLRLIGACSIRSAICHDFAKKVD